MSKIQIKPESKNSDSNKFVVKAKYNHHLKCACEKYSFEGKRN
jgi:hypothetical protein